jgi:hypothetical protein
VGYRGDILGDDVSIHPSIGQPVSEAVADAGGGIEKPTGLLGFARGSNGAVRRTAAMARRIMMQVIS